MSLKSLFKRKSYKFTDKKQSVRGIISTVYFLMAAGMVIYAIYLSFRKGGNASAEIGALGTEALLVAVGGFAMGIYGFKEDEVYLRFPWIGTVGNAAVWLFLLGVILVGI